MTEKLSKQRNQVSPRDLSRAMKLEAALKSEFTRKSLESLIENAGMGRIDARGLSNGTRELLGPEAGWVVVRALTSNKSDLIEMLRATDKTPEVVRFLERVIPLWGPVLHGFLAATQRPDDWSVFETSIMYDLRNRELKLRVDLLKSNKEQLVLNCSYSSWISLVGRIAKDLSQAAELAQKANLKFNGNEESVEALRLSVEKLTSLNEKGAPPKRTEGKL